MKRLKGQVEGLQFRLGEVTSSHPVRNAAAQTHPCGEVVGNGERPATAGPLAAIMANVSASASNADATTLSVDILGVTGFAGAVPSDMRVVLSVTGENHTVSNRSESEALCRPLEGLNEVLWQDCVELAGCSNRDDTLLIELVSSLDHPLVMARGSVPLATFTPCVRGSVTDAARAPPGGSAVKVTTTAESVATISLATTAEYAAFRRESKAPAGATLLQLHVCGTFVGRSRKQDVAAGLPLPACGPSRRRSRLEDAQRACWAHNLLEPPQTEHGEVAADLFELLDANSQDFEDATFTLQEMLELTLLHTRQLQALHKTHQEELQAAAHTASSSATIQVQTDPVPEASPIVVEKVIEKQIEVEKLVEVEKIVEKVRAQPAWVHAATRVCQADCCGALVAHSRCHLLSVRRGCVVPTPGCGEGRYEGGEGDCRKGSNCRGASRHRTRTEAPQAPRG